MLSIADRRSFPSVDDRNQRCLFCGKNLVVLPGDRRDGACFDCSSLLGLDRIACPECGAEMPPDRAEFGCAKCGWTRLPG